MLIRESTNPNDLWDRFTSVLKQGADLFVPKILAKTPFNKKKQHPKSIHKLMNKKRRFWKISRQSKHKGDQDQCQKYCYGILN